MSAINALDPEEVSWWNNLLTRYTPDSWESNIVHTNYSVEYTFPYQSNWVNNFQEATYSTGFYQNPFNTTISYPENASYALPSADEVGEGFQSFLDSRNSNNPNTILENIDNTDPTESAIAETSSSTIPEQGVLSASGASAIIDDDDNYLNRQSYDPTLDSNNSNTINEETSATTNEVAEDSEIAIETGIAEGEAVAGGPIGMAIAAGNMITQGISTGISQSKVADWNTNSYNTYENAISTGHGLGFQTLAYQNLQNNLNAGQQFSSTSNMVGSIFGPAGVLFSSIASPSDFASQFNTNYQVETPSGAFVNAQDGSNINADSYVGSTS